MLIKLEILERIRNGEITIQYRRWRRRTVKAGGTLKTRIGVLKIGEIVPVGANEVTDEDAKKAGFDDARDFLKWLDTMKPGELDRIEVSYLREDPRAELRNKPPQSEDEISAIAAELEAMDQRSKSGAWTAQYLSEIDANEGELAENIAKKMGLEKKSFKARVRKLKALGLTESLTVGYRLSPRGKVVQKYLASSAK